MALKYADPDHTVIVDGNMSIPCVVGNTQYDEIVEQGLTVADYVAPDETMESIRGKRNQLLRDTDWQGMSDVTMSDAQTAYRKKLRDLPATNADPTKIVFPDAP